MPESDSSIRIVDESIVLSELAELAEAVFGNLVKAVVDVDKRIMAVGGELHSDEEEVLLVYGSKQAHLWGINLYPEQYGTDDFVEFDSMINLRPSQDNRSRSVEDPKRQAIIVEIVGQLVKSHD